MKSQLPHLKGQKILITGGLGFIGSNLARKCLELGAEITIYDCLHPRSGGNIYNLHGIRDSVKLCRYDLMDYRRLAKAILRQDIIFNCASSTSHPFSMREPRVDLNINGMGVINLLEAARSFNNHVKLVHLGTSTQLGRLYYKPADEKHPEFPTDIYSANKSVSEKYVLIYGNAYAMRTTVIRLPNVFGPRASIHSPDFTFNNYFIGFSLQGKEITVFGDGRQKRNVLYVDDAVSALILASQTEKVNKQVFFAVSDSHYSVAEIAKATAKYIGCGKVKFVPWPKERKSLEINDAVISNKKIKKALGWAPRWELKTGLVKTKEYFERCLGKYLR